ncbi:MAG TPA: hypothetical protein VNQ31_01310 [Sphingomonadaceae bacterium]|nr:hypothetical protein [Sphingomonadaceae bacterium]
MLLPFAAYAQEMPPPDVGTPPDDAVGAPSPPESMPAPDGTGATYPTNSAEPADNPNATDLPTNDSMHHKHKRGSRAEPAPDAGD